MAGNLRMQRVRSVVRAPIGVANMDRASHCGFGRLVRSMGDRRFEVRPQPKNGAESPGTS